MYPMNSSFIIRTMYSIFVLITISASGGSIPYAVTAKNKLKDILSIEGKFPLPNIWLKNTHPLILASINKK
ncbi:hypothetical protein DSECCO2_406850 [anaerobic digester metagenome]